jgi:hypothetical protein
MNTTLAILLAQSLSLIAFALPLYSAQQASFAISDAARATRFAGLKNIAPARRLPQSPT